MAPLKGQIRRLLGHRKKIIIGVATAICLTAVGSLGFAVALSDKVACASAPRSTREGPVEGNCVEARGDVGAESTASPAQTDTKRVRGGESQTITTTVPTAEPGVILGARVLGGSQPDQPAHGVTDAAERARIEGLLGRKFGLERIYYSWWQDWPTRYAFRTARAGRIPLVSFNSGAYTWRQIADGAGDAWLRGRYRKLKAHPELRAAILIFQSEPEGDQAQKGTPSDYVAAFRHVVRVAREEHLLNRWANTLQDYTINADKPVEVWWPGDDYVDYAGWDIYGARVNTPTVSHCSAAGWQSFYDAAIKPYNFSLAHGKPMIIPELGQREDPDNPQRKANWLNAMRFELKKRFQNIVAISWAHSDFGGICPYASTWWIDTSPQSLAAFAAMAADPYFQGTERRPPSSVDP
jgi:hypothetical protein